MNIQTLREHCYLGGPVYDPVDDWMNMLLHQLIRFFAVATGTTFWWFISIFLNDCDYVRVAWSSLGLFLSFWVLFAMTDQIKAIRERQLRRIQAYYRGVVPSRQELTDFSS